MIAIGLVAKDRTDELSFMIVLMVMAFASFIDRSADSLDRARRA